MSLAQHYHQLLADIDAEAKQQGKPAPRLLAVSKKQPAEAIRALYQLGQRDFGESYWQEAELKQRKLSDLNITWHYIGPLQSNKAAAVAQHFSWVHSVDRLKIATKLSEHHSARSEPLNLCIQVNIDREANKSGADPSAVTELAKAIKTLPNVRLRGLMCIPKQRLDHFEQRLVFQKLSEQMATLNQAGFELDTLSMGMSADWRAALAEGSSWIRIGTALFGERQKNLTNLS